MGAVAQKKFSQRIPLVKGKDLKTELKEVSEWRKEMKATQYGENNFLEKEGLR